MTVREPQFRFLRKSFAACLAKQLILLVLVAGIVAPIMLRPAYGNLPTGPSGQVTESSIKAAFLYRFIGYVEWPPSAFRAADTPYTIAVVGADNVAEKLRYLVAGRIADGRPVEVRRLSVHDTLDNVHVLYIGDVSPVYMENMLRRAQQRSVLSVTDYGHAQHHPSVIHFKMLDKRVRFDVALDVAERSNLKISSRMLAVAHQVKRSGQ